MHRLKEVTRKAFACDPSSKAEQKEERVRHKELQPLLIEEPKISYETELESLLTSELRAILPAHYQRAIPALAKKPGFTSELRRLIQRLKTDHRVILGDAREVRLPSSSVHLIVTSPPYWTLKKYPECEGQLGQIEDYGDFLASLKRVWEACYEALVPGGAYGMRGRRRLCIPSSK